MIAKVQGYLQLNDITRDDQKFDIHIYTQMHGSKNSMEN